MQRVPREISTNRLILRPPVLADAVLWRGLSAAQGAVRVAWGALEDCVGRWEGTGFDFGIVQENSTRAGVGIGGIRHADGDALTLAYSLREEVRGRGLGTEAGRAWTAHALEWLPPLPLIAPLSSEDPTSVRIAVGSGLEPISADTWSGALPPVGGATWYAAPRADTPTWLDPATRSSVLDLWCAVNEAGGAVGFLPGAPRDEVLATLTMHEDAMAAGTTTAVLLRAPDATVVAMGFLVAGHNPLL
ncbi:MAG: GNAT family N-acetyltransferase, partial [Ornithinibacter sp.]